MTATYSVNQTIQKAVYNFYHTPSAIKGLTITAVALLAIGLLVVSILNHHHQIHLFGPLTQWSLLGAGIMTGCALIIATVIYKCTTKYQKGSGCSVNPDYKFLLGKPKGYSVTASDGNIPEWYQNWFERGRRKATFNENKDIQVKWHLTAQIVRKQNGEAFEEIYRTYIPPSYIYSYFPYLKGDQLFIEKYDHSGNHMIAFNVNTKEEREIFSLREGEPINLIRCCGDILIVGYASGLLELRESTSGILAMSYKSKGIVDDAFIDPSKKTLEVISIANGYFNRLLNHRPLKREVWQF